MADHTLIEWTDATWNPITGCSVVSPGCTNCYAMKLAGGRLKTIPSRQGLTQASKAGPVWTGKVRFNAEALDQPLRWRRPRRIFVCAHGDLFHESVPDAWIDQVFAVMATAHRHTFQVLTKRAARMRAYLTHPDREAWIRVALHRLQGDLDAKGAGRRRVNWADIAASDAWAAMKNLELGNDQSSWPKWPLANVWLGVSAEDQARADERIPDLLATPAAVRFVSLEPLLGPVDLTFLDISRGGPQTHIDALRGWAGARLDQVIVGGESGPRPTRAKWVRPIRDACATAGVAFFFKQWGSFLPEGQFDAKGFQWAPGDRCRRVHWWEAPPPYGEPIPDDACAVRVGKKAAGRTLDGVTHDGMPAHG